MASVVLNIKLFTGKEIELTQEKFNEIIAINNNYLKLKTLLCLNFFT